MLNTLAVKKAWFSTFLTLSVYNVTLDMESPSPQPGILMVWSSTWATEVWHNLTEMRPYGQSYIIKDPVLPVSASQPT